MKRNAWNLLAAGTGGALLIVAGWAWVDTGGHRETGESHGAVSPERPPTTTTVHGLKVVVLDPAVQTQAGIRTRALAPTRYRRHIRAYGLVLDPRRLLVWRGRYAAALGRLGVAHAVATTSQREYERLRLLNRDDHNVSLKAVQAAQGTCESARARLAAARANVASLQQTAVAQWGPVLTRWALRQAAGPLTRLFNGQDALVLVTLPLGLAVPSMPAVVRVNNGNGAGAAATLISASPQSDPSIPGETYFYLMPARGVRLGMRVAVAVPLVGRTHRGVVLPNSAVLWYAGQAWVYRQTTTTHFVRHRVSTQVPMRGGWFETDLKPGQRVVTQGAQLLLSQEMFAVSAATGKGTKGHTNQKDSGGHGADEDPDQD
ncbi:MAG: hypothetical protein M0037_09990 [Betaproteobacteria bacterium]|nr:hypothetical protein [Betaproteobacteria bacterium]